MDDVHVRLLTAFSPYSYRVMAGRYFRQRRPRSGIARRSVELALPAFSEAHFPGTSFYAAWVLDPDDSRERRRRALRLELLDQRDHDLYYEDVMRMSDGPAAEELADGFAALSSSLEAARQRNETVYAREAAQLDLPYPRVAGVNVLRELGNLSTCDEAPRTDFLLRASWRGLSGIQHGRASAVMRALNLRDSKRPNTESADY